MSPSKELRVKMNPQFLRFDDAHEITTPSITSTMHDEFDESVLRGPQYRVRSTPAEREILRNRFDVDENRDALPQV